MTIRTVVFLLLILFSQYLPAEEATFPVAYKGRFRPFDIYARLWLYDFYHAQKIKPNDLLAFAESDPTAENILWKSIRRGHKQFDNSPFFWIHHADLKKNLGLNLTKDRFSYTHLHEAIYENEKTNFQFIRPLILYYFIKNYHDPANRTKSTTLELKQLAPELTVSLNELGLVIKNPAPKNALLSFLKMGSLIQDKIDLPTLLKQEKTTAEESLKLLSSLHLYASYTPLDQNAYEQAALHLINLKVPPREIALNLEQDYPLKGRLLETSPLMLALPGKGRATEWYPIQALALKLYDPLTNSLNPVSNFTAYSDEQFSAIQTAYLVLEKAKQTSELHLAEKSLKDLLSKAYQSIAGKAYLKAFEKSLTYPSVFQLKVESFYYNTPLLEIAIILYAMTIAGLILSLTLGSQRLNKASVAILCIAFLIHTAILGIRCFILERPPVSNMFETVIYVPWIAILAATGFWFYFKNSIFLLAASISALGLLILLELTNLNSSMENVQAVLDSQYWLIVHVLLVVGSYGLFILAGILGQIYLSLYCLKKQKRFDMPFLGQSILQTMYLGVALLIPGTILGGVWAAESWGRFWDWDPKESWAFISSCVYLIWIHAYIFNKIGAFGLAIGSVVGLITISFTWYGVNYILGTGLHSYGFGSGGEAYYYLFLVLEIFFIIWASISYIKQKKNIEGGNKIVL